MQIPIKLTQNKKRVLKSYVAILLVLISINYFAQDSTNINTKFMTKPFLGLRTVAYQVPDIEEAKKWYTSIFETTPYFDEPFYVGFNIGGYELGLVPEETTEKLCDSKVLVYWGVADIEASYDRMLHNGALKHEAPHNVGGAIVVASVKDPWGNLIGLIYNPEFKLE